MVYIHKPAFIPPTVASQPNTAYHHMHQTLIMYMMFNKHFGNLKSTEAREMVETMLDLSLSVAAAKGSQDAKVLLSTKAKSYSHPDPHYIAEAEATNEVH